MPTVFIGTPTYGEDINTGAAKAIWAWATQRDDVRVMTGTRGSSLIPGSCNFLLCEALNLREEHGVQWFALLHADIEPEHFWLDKLLAIAEREQADMLSVVVPIKDHRGITSTAVASGREREMGQFCRLTQRQVWHSDFPETFDINQCADALEALPGGLGIARVPRVGLSLNTGCMLVRLDRPWFDADPPTVYFENLDWIEWHWNAQLQKRVLRQRDVSEDWRFSERLRSAGGRLVATRAVAVVHKGLAGFPNNRPWGELENDAAVLEVTQGAAA